MRLLIIAIITYATLSISAYAQTRIERLWRAEGLAEPESALYDDARDRIVVSNIVGHPGEADGAGHLSLLALDGTIIDSHWTTGLDAPKGMALVGNALLVADLTKLHVVNAETGALRKSIAVEGAQFLNDVSANGQVAWITDFMGHSIWRYEAGSVSLWLKDKRLSHPNGVLVDGSRLVIGSWGMGMRNDFSTERPGSLLTVDLATKEIATLPGGAALGNIDGVFRLDGAIIASDWITGTVFSVQNGEATSIATLPAGLADISPFKDGFLAPLMMGAALEVYELK